MTCIEPEVDPLMTFKFDEDYYNSKSDEMSCDDLSKWIDDDEWINNDSGAESMKREVMLPNVDKEIRVVSINEITQLESSEEVDQEAGLLAHHNSHTLAMLKDQNVSVIDSGATIHSTGDSRYLFDKKKTGTFSKVGNGQMVKAAGVWKAKGNGM
jgi:hypothetical protein